MVEIVEKLKNIYTWWFMIFVIFIGFFNIYVDGRILQSRKNKKEAKISKGIGWVYVISALGVYMVLYLLK